MFTTGSPSGAYQPVATLRLTIQMLGKYIISFQQVMNILEKEGSNMVVQLQMKCSEIHEAFSHLSDKV